jgi:hypothetical protein
VGAVLPDGVDVRSNDPPGQAGLVLDAAMLKVFTVTSVVAIAVQPLPDAVTVTEYVPDMPVAALPRTGFWVALL